jgi:hypothetical protein
MKFTLLRFTLLGPVLSFGRLLGTTTSQTGSLMGGYSAIPDITEEHVQAVAQFAVAEVLASNNGGISSDHVDYDFLPLLQQSGEDVHWTLLLGQQAVVAGMNYNLTIEMHKSNNDCLGVFSVEVYDNFGDISIMEWGDEIPCGSPSIPLFADPIVPTNTDTSPIENMVPPSDTPIGGYSTITNLNDKYVKRAANYAVKELAKSHLNNRYCFLSKLQKKNAKYTWTVVRGQQQVVAGMKYKLITKLLDKREHCIGGLEVTVYDHFGDLSIVNWGANVRC